MGLSRRKFTKEFKIAALRQIDGGGSIAAVARSCEIDPSVLHRWRRGFQQGPEHAFPGLGNKRADENRVAELERKVGQQALEIDFLKRCLQRIEEQRMLQVLTWKAAIYQQMGQEMQSKRLAMERMCVLAGVSYVAKERLVRSVHKLLPEFTIEQRN